MVFIHFVFLALMTQETVQSEIQSLRSIQKFVVELRTDSDSMTELVAKIQAIFCPAQPICGALAPETKQNVINTLPETLNVENDTVLVDKLQTLIGVCCLPCSCEDTCKDDNNCCLTKAFENKTTNVQKAASVNSTCVASSSESYRSKRELGPKYSHYFMITQCFFETTVTSQSKCETPNPNDMADTIPVTSLSSGRTYWNQHCAKCNNDAFNIAFWNMTVVFKGDFIFYGDYYGVHFYDNSLDEVDTRVLRRQEIMLDPPFDMQHKRCVPQNYESTCKRTRDDEQEADHQFLQDMCNMFSSPVVTGNMRNIIHKNIFCFFCDRETFISSDKYECSFSDGEREPTEAMTALLNYRHLDETDAAIYVNSHGKGNCSCTEIYDEYQEKCRMVYCPPGSLYSGCRCTEMFEAIFGMPILLKLKVTPEPGSVYQSTDVLAAKFRKALKKAITTSIGHVRVDIVASLRPLNETHSYQLYVAIVRSDFGLNTKQTVKLLLDHMYADKFSEITANKNKYSVRLENKIIIRRFGNQIGSAFDLQNKIELILDYYSDKKYFNGNYQEVSPILFCKQVQLDSSEYTERDGQIIIKTISTVIYLPEFYHTPEKQVRVCVDQYLPTPMKSCGHKNCSVTMTLILLLICLALQQTGNKPPWL